MWKPTTVNAEEGSRTGHGRLSHNMIYQKNTFFPISRTDARGDDWTELIRT